MEIDCGIVEEAPWQPLALDLHIKATAPLAVSYEIVGKEIPDFHSLALPHLGAPIVVKQSLMHCAMHFAALNILLRNPCGPCSIL